MQLSFLVIRSEREAKYEYNISVKAQLHSKLFLIPDRNKPPTSTRSAALPTAAPHTIQVRCGSTNCSTLLSNPSPLMLLQKIEPAHNISLLPPLHSSLQTWVIKHFLYCWRDATVSFTSYCFSTLLNNLLLLFRNPSLNICMEPSVDKSSAKFKNKANLNNNNNNNEFYYHISRTVLPKSNIENSLETTSIICT